MSHVFSLVFNSEVSSPHVLELEGSVWKVAVISSDWSGSVVGWSSFDHAGVVTVRGEEGILELVELDSSVSRLIVSSDEKFYFLVSWEHVNGIEARSKLIGINGSVVWDVKHIEGISHVEIVLLGKGDLGGLEFLLLVAEVLKSVDHFILIENSQNWLSGWGGSGWRNS